MQKTQLLPSAPQQTVGASGMTAIAAMLTAVVALSLAAIFIRLSERELGPFGTIFNRFWVAFLLLWLWDQSHTVRLKLNQNSLTPKATYTLKDILLLIAAGLMFWGCLAFWAWSLTQTGVANSTILHNLTPLFTTLGAWLIFRHSFDRQFLLGLVIALGGAIALGVQDLHLAADNFAGDAASLLSALFSAANLMIIEKLRAKFSAPTIILWCCLIGTIVTFPIVLVTEDRLFPVSPSGWLAILGLAVVCQIIGQGLQAYSLKRLSSGLVGIFLLLDPVLAALIAWVVFVEVLSPLNGLAFCVILLGIYLAKSSQYADQIIMSSPDTVL